MRRTLFTIFLSFGIFTMHAQERGRQAYQFLDIPVSARIAALGGELISVRDGDPTLGANNPSLLNSEMHDKMALSYINYFAGLNYGYSSYTHHQDNLGTFNVGLKYLSYGSFQEIDETGLEIGQFSAGEYALILGWSRSIDSTFSVGANLKTIYSQLYTDYIGVAAALDLGATYEIKEKRFSMTLLFKNMGAQIVKFSENDNSELPFEVQMGASKQLENMPVRFSIVAHNLNQPDLTYKSPLRDDESEIQLSEEENTKKENTFVGSVFQHVIFNAEFIPSKNFNVRLGYNFRQRKEMILQDRPGMVGFSWGLGLKISKFHISYGRAAYHLSGSPNHFTVTTKLSDFYRKNKK